MGVSDGSSPRSKCLSKVPGVPCAKSAKGEILRRSSLRNRWQTEADGSLLLVPALRG